MSSFQLIGQMLVARGLLTQEQLEKALPLGRANRKRLGEVLIDLNLVKEQDVAACLAEQLGYPLLDPSSLTPDPAAIKALSAEYALAHGVLPFANREGRLECLVADPVDVVTTDSISRVVNQPISLFIGPASLVVEAIRRAYRIKQTPPGRRPRRAGCARGPKPQLDRMAVLDMSGTAIEPGMPSWLERRIQ